MTRRYSNVNKNTIIFDASLCTGSSYAWYCDMAYNTKSYRRLNEPILRSVIEELRHTRDWIRRENVIVMQEGVRSLETTVDVLIQKRDYLDRQEQQLRKYRELDECDEIVGSDNRELFSRVIGTYRNLIRHMSSRKFSQAKQERYYEIRKKMLDLSNSEAYVFSSGNMNDIRSPSDSVIDLVSAALYLSVYENRSSTIMTWNEGGKVLMDLATKEYQAQMSQPINVHIVQHRVNKLQYYTYSPRVEASLFSASVPPALKLSPV
jgi:hypothetical protein